MSDSETKIGSAAAGLKPCKRYITTHNPEGKSIYAISPEQVFPYRPGFGGKARSYSVTTSPANLADEADIKAYTSTSGPASYTRPEIVSKLPDGQPGGGSILVVDLEPGAMSAMHRTVSIDYSICVIGVIDHELDGGEKVRLWPGDHIVQRGTNHRWINVSQTEPARFVGVTLPCVPFDIAGKPLEEKFVSSEEYDKEKAKI